MTEERLKYYFEDSIVQSWEEFKNNRILSTDTYEQCYDKIFKVLMNYNHHDDKSWEYFKEIYSDIPRVLRVPLMLETIYQSYNFDLIEMIEMINEYLLTETDDERECRIKRNKEILKGKAKRNKIKLYRGVAENYLLPENALSFTLDKEVAESFLEYHSSGHGSEFGFIYEMEIPIDDDGILFYSNDREEEEVFYWSCDASSIPILMQRGMEDSLYLTEDTLVEYEDDYDIVWFDNKE